MSLEGFQSLDNEIFINSIIKKIQNLSSIRGNLDNSDLNVEIIFGEKNNCHQRGVEYLQYEIPFEKNETSQPERILLMVITMLW